MASVTTKTIGIPSTLIHYLDYFDWRRFFEELGCKVIISDQSSMKIFNDGFKHALNDQCFPIKMYYGHAINLKNNVDIIFIPQLTSLKKGTYSCPKIIGLPQLIKNTIDDLPEIMWCNIDLNSPRKTIKALRKMCSLFTGDKKRINNALTHFQTKMERLDQGDVPIPGSTASKNSTAHKIGIIGHNYTLQDPMLNMNLFSKIEHYGFDYITSQQIPPDQSTEKNYFDSKDVHWDFGQHLIDTAHYFSNHPEIKGIIFLTYFGCGIDAFVEEIFKNQLSESKPYLSLSIDEHSGEAGAITRIEAFLDMIELAERRRS